MSVPFRAASLLSGPHGRIEDRSNNFTALRIALAVFIVYGHALMLPFGVDQAGAWFAGIDGAVQYALDGFFILSGYMLTASLFRGASLSGFAAARILRIFPGLIVTVLVLWLIVGPMETRLGLGAYLQQAQTWWFPLAVIGQISPQATLPGVFDTHAMTYMNGPLWTIRYELACYLAAGLLAAVGVWRRKAGVLGLTALVVAWSVIESIAPYTGPLDDTLYAAARFGGGFLIGASAFALRDRLPLGAVPALALTGLAVLLSGTPLAMVSGQVAVAYVLLWLGFVRLPGRAGAAVREVEDVSYGIYILHWPIGQVVLNAMPEIAPHVLFAAMLAGALGAGWLLRRYVELPALALKPRLSAVFSTGFAGHARTGARAGVPAE
jgi:peptidoglycan/LPS O-acetylase OafA/YrhL